jgi:hypothetical protein
MDTYAQPPPFTGNQNGGIFSVRLRRVIALSSLLPLSDEKDRQQLRLYFR